MSAPDQSFGPRTPAENKCPADLEASNQGGRWDNIGENVFSGFPFWKRIFDLACVSLTAPIWLPVMMLVALWIKIVSPGPVFYRQKRIGYRGRSFTILKFRSMRVNVATELHERHVAQLIQTNRPMTKLDINGDPRLIAGGRLLRALGLDELPQILNVIFGDMSLVGPRPCTPHEYEHYQAWQRGRVSAPPGLTGHWQVSGKNHTTFSEMVRMDLYYAENMSLAFDVRIVFKTVPAVVMQVLDTWKAARREDARLRESAAS